MSRTIPNMLIVLAVCFPEFALSQGKTSPVNGILLPKRSENHGVMNNRQSIVQVDSGTIEVVLIGGDETKLALPPGLHTLLVHSMDPYDPHSPDYSWISKRDTIEILASQLKTVTIEPKSSNASYCCGWKIIK